MNHLAYNTNEALLRGSTIIGEMPLLLSFENHMFYEVLWSKITMDDVA